MNLSELRTRTRLYLDDRNGDRYTSAEITALLNASQQRLQKVIDASDEMYFSDIETYAVVADTDARECQLPTNFRKVIQVEAVMDSGPPVGLEYVDFRKRHESGLINYAGADVSTAGATRLRYYLRGNWLGIVAPTQAYTIKLWYTRRLLDLSSDSDVSEIPVGYHDLLCLEAAKRACGAENRAFPGELSQLHMDGLAELQVFTKRRQMHRASRVNYVPE